MKKITDMKAVIDMAISFLHIEPEPIDTLGELSGLFITHPFFNSSFLVNYREAKALSVSCFFELGYYHILLYKQFSQFSPQALSCFRLYPT